MQVFSHKEALGHEQVVFCRNDAAGLKAIVAIHDTTLGPALGGCRMWPYASEDEALRDVLRLSRGMTYKAACAGLNLGGGKSVIIADPRKDKSEALFRAFGRFVESLGGRYITAEDVGTAVADMDVIAMETRHVTGTSATTGGSGDPSPVTAWGVFHGIKAACAHAFGSADLRGRRVAIQGVGNVGLNLARYLAGEGADLWVSDIDPERCERARREYDARIVVDDDIFGLDVDVLAPCALGGILNDRTIPAIKARVVAGGANNQLDDEERHGRALQERGIVYAPDYVINAGGLINVNAELHRAPREKALRDAEGIFDTLTRIFRLADEKRLPTGAASNAVAEQRIARIAEVQRVRLPLASRP
ncbi:leucine dehydrogenase [Myxococcota bacterium]|nr:leucine dehydrogenase [Myxococcota bacterium]